MVATRSTLQLSKFLCVFFLSGFFIACKPPELTRRLKHLLYQTANRLFIFAVNIGLCDFFGNVAPIFYKKSLYK